MYIDHLKTPRVAGHQVFIKEKHRNVRNMLGRLPHDTAGLVELEFRLRVLVTIATSRGRRRTVSSKWLEHATDGWSCPAGVQGEGVQLDRVAGHPVILQEKHREVCNLNSRSNKRVHNKICPT